MKKNNDEELQSRREFFKKAAKRTLPFLGAVVFGPAISLTTMTSCGCDGCEATCMDECESACTGYCYTSCSGSSSSSGGCSECSSACYSSCEYSSTSSGCSDCSSNCSSNCSNTSTNSNNDNEISEATGAVGGHQYVDMGLSVKWARYNLGSGQPYQYGYYLGWGDISDEGDYHDLYGRLVKDGYVGGTSICGTQYDAASAKWGSAWMMPGKEDFEELVNNCDYKEITINGVVGLKFISKKNGNSIFLPYGGEQYYEDSHKWQQNTQKNKVGCYWTADTKIKGRPYFVYFYNNQGTIKIAIDQEELYSKLSIRPVTTGSGTNTCGSSCTANCQSNSTNGTCSSCASSCSNGCKTTCSGNCPNGCQTLCGGQCQYSCGGTCSYVSAGSNCTGCAKTCSTYCYRTCSLACSSSCQSCCINSSK